MPLGLLALVLTEARAAWWFFDQRPHHPREQTRWQTVTMRAVHASLYLVMIVMGVSGIGLLIVSGAGATLFFGAAEPLPRFSDFPPMIVHGSGAFTIVGLLCLHVGAALHHQFYKRDQLFARMGVGPAAPAPE